MENTAENSRPPNWPILSLQKFQSNPLMVLEILGNKIGSSTRSVDDEWMNDACWWMKDEIKNTNCFFRMINFSILIFLLMTIFAFVPLSVSLSLSLSLSHPLSLSHSLSLSLSPSVSLSLTLSLSWKRISYQKYKESISNVFLSVSEEYYAFSIWLNFINSLRVNILSSQIN